jgi:tRNA dimethylallyltransferase
MVVIIGPTASGKTALALAVARATGGEIVNCDSVAMYRDFEIGTAKPSSAARAEIPHHLVECVEPTASVTAGEYARMGRQVLREISARGRLPIVSGGTGLYLRALLEGLFPGPQRSEDLRNRLRQRVEEHGPEHLHRILSRLDPASAQRIHANDVPKVIRAIEVCLASRRPMTELWKEGREPLQGFRILRFGLAPEREDLYARINQRAAEMFQQGLVAETERLWKKYGDAARPLTSLGYKQAMQVVRGEIGEKPALEAAQQAHRNYAKRQMTWFRQEPEVRWLKGFGDDAVIQEEVLKIVLPLV